MILQSLLAASEATVESDTSTQIGVGVITASALAVVVAVALFVMAVFFRDPIVEWAGASAKRRWVLPISATLAGGLSGALIDIIDLSELINGNPDKHLQFTAPCLIILATIAFCCVFLMRARDECITSLKQNLYDQKKSAESSLAETNKRLTKQVDVATYLKTVAEYRSRLVRELVGEKKSRIRSTIENQGSRASLPMIRSTFEPSKQISINLGCLHRLMSFNADGEQMESLVVALYLPSSDGAAVEHFASTNGEIQQVAAESATRHAEWFALPFKPHKPCLAAYVAENGGFHPIQDSRNLKMEEKSKFSLFYEGQDRTVRSAMGFAIEESPGWPKPVILAHSALPASFSPPAYPTEVLKDDLKAFSYRIAYELDVLRLFYPESKS